MATKAHPLRLSLWLFTLILLSHPSPSASAKCNREDKKALLAIKSFWGNPDLLDTWVSTTGCCDWNGVDCDRATGRVVSLFIGRDFGRSITGTIPPAVGDLPFLESLTFREIPSLTGPIPTDLTRLRRRLRFLTLQASALTGPVPSFLVASLRNLQELDLSRNRLTGSIPSSLSSLPNLTLLDLSRNRLTGSIPESFGGLPSGVSLYLSRNNLTGPVPMSLGSVDFTVLDLSTNRLSGDASFLLRPSKKLFGLEMDISRNMIEFDLSKVKLPRRLTEMYIDHNRIYGSIPPEIAELRLEDMNVSYNRLCGKIPTGGYMDLFGRWEYVGNRCLCGTPLPPCK